MLVTSASPAEYPRKFHLKITFSGQICGVLKPKITIKFILFYHFICECDTVVKLLAAKETPEVCCWMSISPKGSC